MLNSTNSFKQILDAKGVHYDHYPQMDNDSPEVITITTSTDTIQSITVYFFFDSDGTSVHLKTSALCKVPDDKLMEIFVGVNNLNTNFRWVKFTLDDDNEVAAEDDAVLDPNDCGEECLELLAHMVSISEKAYPALMKILFA